MTSPQARHQHSSLPGWEGGADDRNGPPVDTRLGDALATALPVWLEQPGHQPAVTWLDESDGARTELSRSTLTNWTAKLANLLQAELPDKPRADKPRADAPRADGDVALRTSGHWAAVVAALGAWRLGRSVVVDEATGAAITIAHEDIAEGDDLVVGAGMGGALTKPSPTARSFTAEVLAEPDDLDADDPAADAVALIRDRPAVPRGAGPATADQTLSAAAQALEAAPGAWLLATPVDRPAGLVAVAAVVLTGARLVAVRTAGDSAPPSPERLARIATQERVSAILVPRGTDPITGDRIPTLTLPDW